MPAIAFDNWSGGLDLRQSVSMSAANVLAVLRNCYITTGKKIKKRPCLNLVTTLEPGTVGLKAAGGKLNTFYGVGSITHVNALFRANKVAHPTVSQDVVACHFGENFNGFLYAAVEYVDGSVKHHYLDGTSPTHIADANCPNSKIVAKMRQKIYAASGGNVRYCKTTDPRDWTAASDAGFIPASIEAAGSDTVTALGDFRGDLAIFFADSAQLWDIDADPDLNAIKDTSENVGTLHHDAVHPFANDLVFLAASGFRSLALTVLTDNLEESDIGSPIDELREEIADLDRPQAIYYPRLSQLWVVNGARAYVISYSKKAKITAWGIYDFPFNLEALAVLNKELYVRNGDRIYKADRTIFNDNGVAPLCDVEMFYQDNEAPGVLKQFLGFDGVVRGSPSVAFRFDPRTPALQTPFVGISGDMRPGDMFPMEICAVSVAPCFRHQADEDFVIDQLLCYYENLGPL